MKIIQREIEFLNQGGRVVLLDGSILSKIITSGDYKQKFEDGGIYIHSSSQLEEILKQNATLEEDIEDKYYTL